MIKKMENKMLPGTQETWETCSGYAPPHMMVFTRFPFKKQLLCLVLKTSRLSSSL